jgi:hypothetical protein
MHDGAATRFKEADQGMKKYARTPEYDLKNEEFICKNISVSVVLIKGRTDLPHATEP